ncbi:MAG: Imm7 family immunity protein [Nocardioidaceae bacterium]
MFEYHGWARVRDFLDTDHSEAADGLTRAAHDVVLAALSRVTNDFQSTDLRVVNGSCHVWLAGLRNHRNDAVVDAFREIAVAAPLSYGLLSVYDDESVEDPNRWVTWVMKRGSVTPRPDTFLSPHVGEVEDDLE